MQFAILSGDPKNGACTQKYANPPAGTDNGLHSHSSEIKNVIISGVWYTGTDAASAKDFGSGSVSGHAGRPDTRGSFPYGNRFRLLSRG